MILLVEDNVADVFFVREALKQEGIDKDFVIAENGEKAIDFVEAAEADLQLPRPDIILLDLNLPRTSGVQVLRRVRQGPRCANIPVIIVTSSDAPTDRAEAASLGANKYFLKPHNLDEYMKLGSLVRAFL